MGILKHTHNPSKQTTQTIKMETIKNAANYVAESVQGGGAQASKEANKQVAKDGEPASEPVPLLPRMPSQTRSINPPTRARLISTRRLLSTKLLATKKQTYLTTVR